MNDPSGPRGLAGMERRELPLRAIALSAVTLALPPVVNLVFAPSVRGYEVLLWLVALVPTFVVSLYRCGRAVTGPLAVGFAAMVTVQVILRVQGAPSLPSSELVVLAGTYLLMGLAVGSLSRMIHLERARAMELAFTDWLTGLPNRRLAERVLEREVAAARRGRELCVVMWDLDDFKQFNDTHGHPAGDQVLRRFGRILQGLTRTMNLSTRWGGEEFLSVVSSSSLAGSLVFVERVQAALLAEAVHGDRVTVSAGVAVFGPQLGTVSEMLEAADQALYQAKAEGRGLVGVVDGGGPASVVAA